MLGPIQQFIEMLIRQQSGEGMPPRDPPFAGNYGMDMGAHIGTPTPPTMPYRPPMQQGPEPPIYGRGNIPLNNRPNVRNPDGSVSSVRSMGVNLDGRETLIPTVADEGRVMSDNEAVERYRKTGRHLGQFSSIAAANDYAQRLHEQQETQGPLARLLGGMR